MAESSKNREVWHNVAHVIGGLSWRFFAGLIAAELVFVFLNVVPTFSVTINRLVELDAESTLPTWFSSSQLLLLALTCGVAWKLDSGRGWKKLGWLCLAVLFGYLSIDETATVHESFGASVAKQLHWSLWGDAFWLLVFAPFVFAAVFLMAVVIWNKLRFDRVAFILALAAIAAWIGSLGLETAAKWLTWTHDSNGRLYQSFVLLEELLEMGGATLLWASAVGWIRRQVQYRTSHSLI